MLVFIALLLAEWTGGVIRRRLPVHHISPDTRETVKLAMGLVATMTALLLGLLISSAKGSYETTRSQVSQMAAKVTLIDRFLAVYGPEAAEARRQFHLTAEELIRRMWPPEGGLVAQSIPSTQMASATHAAIQSLVPRDEAQRNLKEQTTTLVMELAMLRVLLLTESVSSISNLLLAVVVAWLVAIFVSFSAMAPANATARLAIWVAALSVSGGIFLILELGRPFGGLFQVSSQPMLDAMARMGS